MDWNKLIKDCEQYFYTGIFMELTSVIVIILFLTRKEKPKGTIWLAALAFASLAQSVISQFHLLQPKILILGKHPVFNSIFIYIAIETTCCLSFLKAHIQSGLISQIIPVLNLLFGGYAFFYWITTPYTGYFPTHLETIESFLIVSFSLSFFYELFSQKPDEKLIIEPSFWAISGILVVFSILTPLFLLLDFLRIPLYKRLFTINYIAYSLLFITFAIAILCSKKPRGQTINSLS